METVKDVQEQISLAMENIRLERARDNRLSTLHESARILRENGRVELSELVLLASETISWK